jgi:gamma-glutamyl phosphate reductase
MRTMPIAGAALVVALSTAATTPDVHAENGNCIVYTELPHKDSQTLDVHLENTCSKSMACTVAWTVTCGKTASVTRKSAVLAGSAEQSWVASAASCDADWAIDSTWSCKPPG